MRDYGRVIEVQVTDWSDQVAIVTGTPAASGGRLHEHWRREARRFASTTYPERQKPKPKPAKLRQRADASLRSKQGVADADAVMQLVVRMEAE